MRLYKREDRWCIDYRNPVTGKRIREIVGTNRKQAEIRLSKIQTEKVLYDTYGNKEYFYNISKQAKQIKFNEMVKIYLDYAKDNKRSWGRDVVLLNHWLEFSPYPNQDKKMEDMYLSEIIVKMVEDYKIIRIKEVRKSTCNREVACLKHLFNKAIEWDYARENPVGKIKLFREDNSRVRFLEREEIDELLKACDSLQKAEHLKPIVIIALNTGLRKSEILNLKWKNLDFKNDLIYIETSKSGEGDYVSMNNTVKETLKNLSPISELKDGETVISEYLFRGRGGKPFGNVRTSFDNALKKAGIKDFRFHDLRHTFASHLVMSGVDLATVKELMRHKDIKMTLRYAHLSPQHKKEAIEGLYRKKDGTNMAQEQFKQKA